MKYLDLTFSDPSANVACDEALLELFECGRDDAGCLRVWQPENYFIVLGHANRLKTEVNIEACRSDRIAILRRVSGGGAVLQGPGCLNYSLILHSRGHRLGNIRETFAYVLRRHRHLFESWCGVKARIQGISDLTLAGRKFSGNAQYRKSRFVLVHGSFLLNFDLPLMERYLLTPSKQPEYRGGRSHLEFTMNLKIDAPRICVALRDAWRAWAVMDDVPSGRIGELVHCRYGNAAWTEKF